MSRLETPFRYDHVGSFLRPEKLKEARRKFDDGDIGYDELKKVEDEAITELVGKLKEIGYHVITDGEFRRATWHLDFMWGFDGIGHVETKTGLPFHGEAAMIDDTFLVGKIKSSKEHPFVEHFRFVKQFEDEETVAKQTIPAPAQFFAQFTMPFNRVETEKYYSSDDEFAGWGDYNDSSLRLVTVDMTYESDVSYSKDGVVDTLSFYLDRGEIDESNELQPPVTTNYFYSGEDVSAQNSRSVTFASPVYAEIDGQKADLVDVGITMNRDGEKHDLKVYFLVDESEIEDSYMSISNDDGYSQKYDYISVYLGEGK